MVTEHVDWHRVNDPHPKGITNLKRVAKTLADAQAFDNARSVTIPYLSKHTGIADPQLRQMLIASPKPGIVIVETTPANKRFYVLPGWEEYPTTYTGKRGQIIPQREIMWDDGPSATDKVFTSEGVIASRETAQSNTALVLEHAKTLQRLQEYESLPVAKVKSGATGKIIVETANLEITPEVVSFLAEQFEKMVKGDKEAALQCLLISATIYTSKE